jgi:hypothetical protein
LANRRANFTANSSANAPAENSDFLDESNSYLVLLDTAASIETPAMADYDLFLKNLTVE